RGSYVDRMRRAILLSIITVAGVVYHLAQRSARGTNPWIVLVVAYAVALALSVTVALALGAFDHVEYSARDAACGAFIGLAAFGIEAGYLFAYRSGLKLGSASVLAGAAGTTALALIGALVFSERITAGRAIGIALATTGAALVARG